MYVITGASDNHYLSLMNMIDSFIKYKYKHDDNPKLIIYNLGLQEIYWNNIKEKYNDKNFIFKIFDYSKYPEWFNININAGEYAWKPTIIYNTYLEFKDEIIVWMDAGNLITSNLIKMENFLLKNFIFSANSSGNIKKWTHSSTLKYMNCTNVNELNRNGACIGFNTKNDLVKELITEFYNCSQDKNCIAPDGSSRANHRQDQAVFTILFYKYFAGIGDKCKEHLCYSIHNDIDPH